MAHDTFPLVVQMMDLPTYIEAVTAGIVLSVGGLTESVVKASKSAMFDWIRGHIQAKNFGLLRRFAFFLVALLSRHQGDDRVSIPVMKTLATLLESNLLQFLFDEGQRETASSSQPTTSSEFGTRLYDALRDEIQKCTAVPKLSAGIAVLVGLLPSDTHTQSRTLKALLLFLAHRFPKVRKLTAERLYTRLLVYEEMVDEEKVRGGGSLHLLHCSLTDMLLVCWHQCGQYDLVLEKLSDTAWDAPVRSCLAANARESMVQILIGCLPLECCRSRKCGRRATNYWTCSTWSGRRRSSKPAPRPSWCSQGTPTMAATEHACVNLVDRRVEDGGDN